MLLGDRLYFCTGVLDVVMPFITYIQLYLCLYCCVFRGVQCKVL